MYARVCSVALLLYACAIDAENLDILNTKLELEPVHVSAGLNDIVILSAPVATSDTIYFLSKPNGDNLKLNLNLSRINESNLKIITPIEKYRIFNLNDIQCSDLFEKEKTLMSNDFVIGPLLEEDHGNWVLSAYFISHGEWIEVFQVITIEIIESLPSVPVNTNMSPGEDFLLRFAYPINDIESCEITAPSSTFDRYYDRDKKHLDHCGFLIPNVTKHDEGMWKIIGVGRIVYEAHVSLIINETL